MISRSRFANQAAAQRRDDARCHWDWDGSRIQNDSGLPQGPAVPAWPRSLPSWLTVRWQHR